jgi:transposase
LLRLADWLATAGCTHVAMESTGVYWRPVYQILEGLFELLLVNAQHIKAVPGRKTDVKDCQWIARLLEHGLLRASFVPPAPLRELRELTRYRRQLVQARAREANRVQKVLETANIKLGNVATDVLGASRRAMLKALIAGERDAEALADLAQGLLRKKEAQLREALVGRVTDYHAFMLQELLSHIEFLDQQIARFDVRIEAQTRPFRRGPRAPRHDSRRRAAQRRADPRRTRRRYEPLSHGGPGRLVDGHLSRPPRECRQAQVWPDAQRQPLAPRHADRVCPGRRAGAG